MTPSIDYDFAGPAPQIGLFGLSPRSERVTAPFTPAHRAALIEVGNASCDSNADGGDWITESVVLDDGLLVWDAGVDRLTFTAVRGDDGLYVQVLTGPTAAHLTARADWPINLELPHETARTIWHLIGIFTI
ncbi:hypothetical protein [Rhodococcus artemisiae]|uniref:Uncharacterized protein n=1 Tax=Rhodococcus artemisiae TaxID=714159 RepID=A0ABU7LK05_9NOCA|nr:hypothetical protein [Rhodococcus artemisiae]MEE2061840.1 hypothetical protein [Rhodococcus artemisiae]